MRCQLDGESKVTQRDPDVPKERRNLKAEEKQRITERWPKLQCAQKRARPERTQMSLG